MLTTAAILMALGTDPKNAHYALSHRSENAGISFAKSFDESSALAGEITQIINRRAQKDTADAESALSVKHHDLLAALSSLKVKGNVNAEEGMQNEPHGIKSETVPLSTKGAASISSRETMTTTDGLLPHREGSKEETSRPVQAKMPDDPPPAGDVKDVGQQSAPEEIDGAKADATDGMAVPRTDVTVLPMLPISDKSERPGIQDQKEMPVSEKDQETISTKTLAKNHDGVTKTAKTSKTEDNSGKTFVTTANAVDLEAQTVVTVPVMVLPMVGPSAKLNALPDDALLSGASAAAERSVGMTAIAASKADKQSVSAAKADGDRMKSVASALVDDPALKKTEIVETKTASSAAKVTDGESAKAQNPMAAVTAPVSPHIGQGIPGAGIGGISDGAAAHVITASSQRTGGSAHAAISQAESGAIDTAAPTDAMRKTLMATPTALEVGVANGTHGWLKIRAEMTGDGAVNASLSTASSSGQEMLHRELPSMTAYLQSERLIVNTVVVQTTVAAGAGSQGLAGQTNSDGRGQSSPQSGGQGGENRQGAASTAVSRTEKDVPYNDISGVGDGLLSAASYAGGGSWLNVRA